MKGAFAYILIGIVVIASLVGVSYGLGWVGVHQTETIGKARQNAERKVYEETNSFVKGKRQEIIKYYREWQQAETLEDKKAIEEILSMSLADFDEDRFITDDKLLSWVKTIKY